MFDNVRCPLIALATCLLTLSGCGRSSAPSATVSSAPQPPKMQIDPAKHYLAVLDTTQGKIILELFASEAPKTVNNFVALSRSGFYNGLIFHRVIPGFMIQGGDPKGNGSGGPGYEFENENRDTARTFVTGTVGMANSGLDTNGSQFFIMDASNGLPPQKYTIFAQVKEGQDVVHQIAKAPRNAHDFPDHPVTIRSIAITEY